MPLATGGPTDSTSCNFSGCERTHRFISSPVSVDKVWPAGFSSGLALLISYGSFALPAGYSRELVYCPGILAGDRCCVPACGRQGSKRIIRHPVGQTGTYLVCGGTITICITFCGHMWDSNPSVSVQGRSATVTLHGPFEKLGSFVVLPEAPGNFRLNPGVYRTNVGSLIFHRRQWSPEARYGSGLNPKHSKPLFT